MNLRTMEGKERKILLREIALERQEGGHRSYFTEELLYSKIGRWVKNHEMGTMWIKMLVNQSDCKYRCLGSINLIGKYIM